MVAVPPCWDWGYLCFRLGWLVELQMQKPKRDGIIGGGEIYIYQQDVIEEILIKESLSWRNVLKLSCVIFKAKHYWNS